MQKAIKFYHNTRTMTGRCLLLSKRNTDTILTSLILPILLMTMFVFVFGGAMNVGDVSYVNYIVPGIILQCLGQSAATTAITMNNDLKNGIIDRYYTMPIQKTSILWGHVISAVVRNVMTTVIIIVVALMIGFRPEAGFSGWLCVSGILLLYIVALSWISIYLGIKASSPEGAGAYVVFAAVLPFLSSAFVPVDTMPTLLRVFSEHQPMTPILESMRALFFGEPLGSETWMIAIGWCLLLIVVFYVLSKRLFKYKITA